MNLFGLQLSEIILILFLVLFMIIYVEAFVHYEAVFETIRRKGVRATFRMVLAIIVHDLAGIFVK